MSTENTVTGNNTKGTNTCIALIHSINYPKTIYFIDLLIVLQRHVSRLTKANKRKNGKKNQTCELKLH